MLVRQFDKRARGSACPVRAGLVGRQTRSVCVELAFSSQTPASVRGRGGDGHFLSAVNTQLIRSSELKNTLATFTFVFTSMTVANGHISTALDDLPLRSIDHSAFPVSR